MRLECELYTVKHLNRVFPNSIGENNFQLKLSIARQIGICYVRPDYRRIHRTIKLSAGLDANAASVTYTLCITHTHRFRGLLSFCIISHHFMSFCLWHELCVIFESDTGRLDKKTAVLTFERQVSIKLQRWEKGNKQKKAKQRISRLKNWNVPNF